VVDAKWKRLDPHAADFGVDEADVYQLLAYALRYGCPQLELVYPAAVPDGEGLQERLVFKIAAIGEVGPPIEIRVKTVALWDTSTATTRTGPRMGPFR
jgi:5-methylcytosine-specific restriction enzyme subunit McrC